MRYMRSAIVFVISACCLISTAPAATFNFDTLPLLVPVTSSTAGGVTATFSAGFTTQDNLTAVFPVPPPFSRRFLYPDSLSSSVLDISFDAMLTGINLDFALTTNGPYLDQFSPIRLTAGSGSDSSLGTPSGAYNIGSLQVLSVTPFNSRSYRRT